MLIGAHFDSWHGGTGATDNAAGSAAMMEVLRILKATGLKPRRTVRIGLWGAEENGLLGSQAYVREHLGTREAPKPELAKTTRVLQPRQRHRQDSRHLDAEQHGREADLRGLDRGR